MVLMEFWEWDLRKDMVLSGRKEWRRTQIRVYENLHRRWGADDGSESNGGWIGLVGFGYGGLLYRAAFPYEAQRVMRMKDIYKLTWDDCRRGLRRGQK